MNLLFWVTITIVSLVVATIQTFFMVLYWKIAIRRSPSKLWVHIGSGGKVGSWSHIWNQSYIKTRKYFRR